MAEDSGLTSSLHHKVGGVPVWGLGVGGAGVLILVLVYRNHLKANAAPAQSTTPDPSQVDSTANNDATNPLLQAYDDYLASDPTNPAFLNGITSTGAPSPLTNIQWARQALDLLVSMGDDPSLVSNALTKYLSGGTLSAAEKGVVNVALEKIGAPPEGLLPVTTGTTPPPSQLPPPPKPPKPPTGGKSYTVRSGDTLFGIAASHGVSEPTLYNANKTVIENAAHAHHLNSSENGHWIFPGTVLVIP